MRHEYQARDGRSVLVRRSAYGDAPALHAGLLDVAAEGVHIGLEPEGVGDLTAVIERLRVALTSPRMAHMVAELDGDVVGAVGIRPGRFGRKDQHLCHLGMWVVPGARGIGVGTALLKAALAVAQDKDFTKVVVEVFASNALAIGLYRKFGFETEGRQRRQFVLPGLGQVDNLLMAVELS